MSTNAASLGRRREGRGEGAPHVGHRVRIGMLIGAVLCGGCASRAPISTATLVVSTQPASEPIESVLIFPMEASSDEFVLMEKEEAQNATVTIRREPTGEHGASMAIAEGDARVEFLARNESGEIALHAVIDRKEKALTLFDPPLIVAPKSLAPGETFHSEASMRVVDVNNPQKQRERGKAKRSITYMADAVIRTPRGEVQAAQIDIHFTADLRLADAEERTTLYIAREDDGDAAGLIASDSREKITILGAFPRETHRVLVRHR